MNVRVKFKLDDCCVTYEGDADCSVAGGCRGSRDEPGEAAEVVVLRVDIDSMTLTFDGDKSVLLSVIGTPAERDGLLSRYVADQLEKDPEFCDRARWLAR